MSCGLFLGLAAELLTKATPAFLSKSQFPHLKMRVMNNMLIHQVPETMNFVEKMYLGQTDV